MAPKRRSSSSDSPTNSSKKPKTETKTAKKPKDEPKTENKPNTEPKTEIADDTFPDLVSDTGIDSDCRFVGEPIPHDQAFERWAHRYQKKNKGTSPIVIPESFEEGSNITQAKKHFSEAVVDGINYSLNDYAHVQSGEDTLPYICKVVEMFEALDGKCYFRARWFYRAGDTEIKETFPMREAKRVFISKVEDDNDLSCLVKKLQIVKLSPNVDVDKKQRNIPHCDYYYDMLYLIPYSTFVKAPYEENAASSGSFSSTLSDLDEEVALSGDTKPFENDICQSNVTEVSEMRLLDLYAGCGAMSTGITLGANMSGVNLVTRWAVDFNKHACESLKANHPETEVRNETVEDFLMLLKEWEKICVHFSLKEGNAKYEAFQDNDENNDDGEDDKDDGKDDKDDGEDADEFEVENVLAVCYGDPKMNKEPGVYFKVHWKGYGPEEDTWEPAKGLCGCLDKVKDFVVCGFKAKVLPLPGDVDAICGGPPCQGISGFNRFRNTEAPLEDLKNMQLTVYMDVVDYLKPKFVLMENVVDMVKFSEGFLGRYALGRLVDMNYQVRMGIMAAGAYGLPQFRMRLFIWGARPTEILPQYALPTHDVVTRGGAPNAFEKIVVAHQEGHQVHLKGKLFLEDAISDLPGVTNDESRDEMPYTREPITDFQKFIRLTKDASLGHEVNGSVYTPCLYDHSPLNLNNDDYLRVCQIPKKKGACFRDLPGVRVGDKNKVEFDPNIPRVLLPSKKPLVPDYAMTFVRGTSSKPFARLWWDQTVPTVVTRAEPHNQAILHPLQDRVLTVRENARLQGFPDYYKLYGPIKERYMQVGNAVATPVARALGFALGRACRGEVGDGGPLFTLPPNFPTPTPQNPPSPSISHD